MYHVKKNKCLNHLSFWGYSDFGHRVLVWQDQNKSNLWNFFALTVTNTWANRSKQTAICPQFIVSHHAFQACPHCWLSRDYICHHSHKSVCANLPRPENGWLVFLTATVLYLKEHREPAATVRVITVCACPGGANLKNLNLKKMLLIWLVWTCPKISYMYCIVDRRQKSTGGWFRVPLFRHLTNVLMHVLFQNRKTFK